MSKATEPASSSQRSDVKPTRNKVRLAVAAGGGLTVLSLTAALAISALLPAGGHLSVPPTTAATEPSLEGTVVYDQVLPFRIDTLAGTLFCAGNLENRVIRSTATGDFDFYYRVRNTKGPGTLGRLVTSSFAGLPLRVAYRADGPGKVDPRVAIRSAAPGAAVTFELFDTLSCARHQGSRFMLIETMAKTFHNGGQTRIFSTKGTGETLPTVMPG